MSKVTYSVIYKLYDSIAVLHTNSSKLASLNVEEYTTKQMTNDIKLDKTPNVQK
jgi:hypothetical protein